MVEFAESASARSVAHAALLRIVKGGHLDEALDDPAFAKLDGRDRAFARLLVMTVLRHRGHIEAVLAAFMGKALPGKAQASTMVLWIGVAQLLYLQTPAHAAVHASVELAGKVDRGGFKGLVNAVLKRVAAEGGDALTSLDASLLLPAWLWQKLVEAYGGETARAIAEGQVLEPPLDLTVKENPEKWAADLQGTALPNGTVRLRASGRIDALPGYDEGSWWVQDAAASLPARLLGELGGKRVWDLCAAPGGKTAQLVLAGGDVLAVDSSAPRMQRLKGNLARLKLQAEVLVMDALRIDTRPGAEAILLDAPCSATGTLRRNPDVAWRRNENDLAELAALQRAMLDHASECLLPGGMLVYCVCSLLPEEGEAQMRDFLARHPEMRLMPILPDELPGMAEAISPEGALRSLPSMLAAQGGMDGFFAFRAVKRG